SSMMRVRSSSTTMSLRDFGRTRFIESPWLWRLRSGISVFHRGASDRNAHCGGRATRGSWPKDQIDSASGDPNTARKLQANMLQGGSRMPLTTSRRSLIKGSAAGAAALALPIRFASAQDAPIRIGVIYDLSGPFAAGGSVASSIGAQIAIDLINERGGVAGKYKVQPINADSQSKADAAINEVERLINQEKVEIVLGVYASAHAVPLAAKMEAQKKILWITTAIATAVFKNKNLTYVFRAQIHSDQYGQAFASFLAENAKAKLAVEPKDVKVAIIHEDGPYGVGVAQ